MSVTNGGYPVELFLNTEHALQYQCAICHNVCRNPVQLNCPGGHLFCDDCINCEPHTITTTEPIWYDANNNSNELAVNEDYATQTQINVSSTHTTCPICKIEKCSRLPCPQRIQNDIYLLSIRCINTCYGCKWNGTLGDLYNHTQTNCVNCTRDCPFHVFGCKIKGVPEQELMTHFQTAQMQHLQLQINAITALQTAHQQMQAQVNTLNNQQVHLTKLITEYEVKLNEINTPIQTDRNGSNNGKNLQFNINMNNNNGNIPIINENDRNYHRYKDNPIIKKIVDLQKAIIDQQGAKNTINNIHKISNEYTLAELSELYININKSTPYLPTIHKKLCIIQGSCNKQSVYHNIFGIDLHNKKKYKLLNDINDPIITYQSWDVEFSGLTVINNINTKIFQKLIRDDKERMLFSLKNGLNMIKYNNNNNEFDKDREQYLENKCNQLTEENKSMNDNDIITNKTCSILLRCGGSIVSPSGATQRVNGLVLHNGDWVSSLPNLQVPRYGNSALYSKNNGVIVVGGKDDKEYLNVVERWDVSKGQTAWDLLPHMNVKRYSPCCSIFNYNDNNSDECLFVGGGWNANKYLDTCEIYSFFNGYWNTCKSMNIKRYGSGCTIWDISSKYGAKIMVGGGHNKAAAKSVEEFDMHKQIWMSLPNTNGKHRNTPALWVCKEYGKFLSPFCGLLCIAGDIWYKDNKNNSQGCINGYIEMYDHREWRQQWFICEDLKNILIDHKNAVVRGIIPFS